MLKNKKRKLNSNKGITLIALVVTIVILLILAGVTLSTVLSNNGIITKAKDAKNEWEQAVQNDEETLNSLIDEFDEIMNEVRNSGGNSGGNTTEPLTSTLTEIQVETVIARDAKGNQVVVPKNFKISNESGTTVQQGIVVEDSIGNQYVWVPVSNIDASGSNKIILDDDTEVEITLGRYTFDAIWNSSTSTVDGTGEATLQQKGSEWENETAFSKDVNTTWTVTELKNFRTGNTNTTAKDLQGFIESVRDNKGYYMARYEASKEDGTSTTRFVSKANVVAWSGDYEEHAAIVCKNMYAETDDDVECDLMNSFAWDTAVVYIQKCTGDISYSKANGVNNSSKVNTGMAGDEKCKINDMAANLHEMTTEYSGFLTQVGRNYPCSVWGVGLCVWVGVCFFQRGDNYASGSSASNVGFRTLIYLN